MTTIKSDRYLIGSMINFTKLLFIIVMYVAFFSQAQAQNYHKIDSLEKELERQKEDTNKVNTLILLCREAFNYNADTLNYYAQATQKLSVKLGFKRGQAKSFQGFAVAARNSGNYPLALNYQHQWLELAEQMNEKKEIFAANNSIANTYRDMGEYKTELKYRLKAIELAQESNDNESIAKGYSGLGGTYVTVGDYKNAMLYTLKALKINEELNNRKEIAACYNIIGGIYSVQKNYDNAITSYHHSMAIGHELRDLKLLQLGTFAIAQINRNLKNYDEAIKYYNQSLEVSKQLMDKKWMGGNYNGIGQVLREQGKIKEALKYQQMCISIADQIGDKSMMSGCYQQLSELNIALGSFKNAIGFIQKSMEITKYTGDKKAMERDHKTLSECYYNTGEFKKSTENLLLSTYFSDTLSSEATKQLTAELEAKYNNDKKEKEIILLTKDKEIQNIEIKKQKVLKYSFIGGLALFALLTVFVFNNFRARNMLRLQSIRNRIADDLHDDIGSTLNSISVYSEVAKQKSPAVIQELEQIGEASRKVIEAMSDIVWTINPENDSFEDIILRMRSFSYNLLRAKNIEHSFRADETLNNLKLLLQDRRNFYLFFKEAINNLAKHSNATRAEIHLTYENYFITLMIRDNGKGFDTLKEYNGNGINSMKKRAEEMDASLQVASEVNNGTTIQLKIKA
jgi:two-component system sensor histidine kinase UhpB